MQISQLNFPKETDNLKQLKFYMPRELSNRHEDFLNYMSTNKHADVVKLYVVFHQETWGM